jgi:hypothetical protein
MARRTKAETAPEVEEASELVIAEPVASDRSDEAISETTSNTEPSETRPSLDQPDRSSQTETIGPNTGVQYSCRWWLVARLQHSQAWVPGCILQRLTRMHWASSAAPALISACPTMTSDLTDLAAQVASLPAQTLDVTGLVGLKAETDAALAAAKTREDELTQRLQVLSDRLATLESAPVAAGGATAAQIAALTEEAQKKAPRSPSKRPKR